MAEAAAQVKIDLAMETPNMFPVDIDFTDVDCAAMFNMETANYGTWVLI